MQALVSGGAGFIGSHLVDALVARGWRVRVIDNLVTGHRSNLTAALASGRVEFVEADVATVGESPELLADIDVVYHLAASVGVRHIMDNLVASITNNVIGTERMLAAASSRRLPILITSTSEVYGKTNDRPSREDDDLRMGSTLKSRWSYACSKALDEYLAFSYYHEQDLPVRVVRLFNTVGERQSSAYGMVIPTFIRQALQNRPLTIHGQGQQQRCFAYVGDVVGALIALMDRPDAVGHVFNVGSTEEVTISELAQRILRQTGSVSPVEYVPYDQAYRTGFDDAERRRPDLTKIQQCIGYQPTATLDMIIAAVVADVRAQLTHEASVAAHA